MRYFDTENMNQVVNAIVLEYGVPLTLEALIKSEGERMVRKIPFPISLLGAGSNAQRF